MIWAGGLLGAANVWMSSCNRNNGNNVTYVNSSGNCNNNNAYNGNRCAPDSAYHAGIRPTHSDGAPRHRHREPATRGDRRGRLPNVSGATAASLGTARL